MGTSQLLVPRNSAFRPKTRVLEVFMCRRLAKSSEILANIILGTIDWIGCCTTLVPRNSAFGLEHKFCVFYVSMVSEMLWNTPKHHFGSSGLEWTLHNFGTLEFVHLGPKHNFCKYLWAEVSEIIRNTRKHRFGSNGLEWMLHNFGTPK
jgi:hypothetical protein